MRFLVIPNQVRVPNEGRNIVFLHSDNWNDWFKYRTAYYGSKGDATLFVLCLWVSGDIYGSPRDARKKFARDKKNIATIYSAFR